MEEYNPNNIEPAPRPLTPEELAALEMKRQEQLKAHEMLESLEHAKTQESGVAWDRGPSSEHVDQVTQIVQRLDTHMEAGIELENKIPENKLKEAGNKLLSFSKKVEKAEQIRNSNKTGFAQTEALTEVWEEAA